MKDSFTGQVKNGEIVEVGKNAVLRDIRHFYVTKSCIAS